MPIRDVAAAHSPGQAARLALGLSARARIDDGRSQLLKIIASLYDRWRQLVHELAKFGIVGAINTVLDFGLANLLYLGFGWPSLGAKTASVAVAATSSFFMNRHWTFRHRARTGLRREYTLFFLLNGVGLLIANGCILVVEQGFGKTGVVWFNLAQVAGLALGMVFRFATYRRYVFVSHERAAARSLEPAGSRAAR
jgi:putative flippase GtrA